MTRGVFGWTYREVVDVLKEKGFSLNHTKGSHHFYVGTVEGKLHQVCVPKHSNKAFKPRTFKSMVTQSGLPRDIWGL